MPMSRTAASYSIAVALIVPWPAGVNEVNCVVVASETFSERNQRMSVADSVHIVRDLVDDARIAGVGVSVTIATAFGCPFEGEVSESAVLALVEQMADLGVDEIALADTIGVGVPPKSPDCLQRPRRSRAEFGCAPIFTTLATPDMPMLSQLSTWG